MELEKKIAYISFNHIYLILNQDVDQLSKCELGFMDGMMFFEELYEDRLIDSGTYFVF